MRFCKSDSSIVSNTEQKIFKKYWYENIEMKKDDLEKI